MNESQLQQLQHFELFMAVKTTYGESAAAAIAAIKPKFGNCTKNESESEEFEESSESGVG